MAPSSDSNQEPIKQDEENKDTTVAATAKADHKTPPTKKDDSSFDSSQEKMGPDIHKDGSKPRW